MAIGPATRDEIQAVAEELGLSLEAGDLDVFPELIAPFLEGVSELDSLPDVFPEVRHPRTPGRRPEPEENPLGAWYVQTRVEGAAEGPLAGKRVALKDNIMLAGVPMMNGTRILDGYVPPVDATIVTRMLDAGAIISGKAVCESFCASGGSHTSDTGPVRNPHDPTRTAGGSSSGSAALVAAGEVDLAIGCDQGGSIRIPSSYCGIVGMKPTHGLVPYTGILGMDATIDHAGPMSANVADNALLLEVIAGADGIDGRQRDVRTEAYSQTLSQGCQGLRIGILEEGFGHPGSDPEVDRIVREAAESWAALGVKVSTVSVPLHRMVPTLLASVFQSSMMTIFHTDGCGPGREDLFVPSLYERQRNWRERAGDLPKPLLAFGLCAEVLRKRYGWRYYAKAMNLIRRVRADYDAALSGVDALLMPTAGCVAPPLPAPEATTAEVVAAAFSPIANTPAFDYSHHPALSLPCGWSQGLPVGAMLVGRPYEESLLYRLAGAFEAASSDS